MYPNGFQGDFQDDVPDRCKDLSVTLGTYIGKGTDGTFDILTGMSPFTSRILKKCLGDSV